jgi:hypothetical protein
MTGVKTYWLTDGQDTFALVAGADERDRMVPLGWTATDEPTEGWVHIWREGIEQPGRVPVATLRDLWGPLGWVAGPPPGGTHPATPEPPAEPPEAEAEKAQESAGGNKGKAEKTP